MCIHSFHVLLIAQRSLATQECTKIAKLTDTRPKQAFEIQAIYGIMNMEVNKYLVVVTKSMLVGQIFKKVVFRVEKLEFICLHSQ